MGRWLTAIWLIFACHLEAAPKQEILLLVHGSENAADIRKLRPRALATDTNQLLLRSLGPYPLKFQTATMTRIDRLLQTQKNACSINRVKTPKRESRSYFSKPINLYLGFRMYYLERPLGLPQSALNQEGQLVSLAALFEALPEQKVGMRKDRSYGRKLDIQLRKLNKKHKLVRGDKASLSAMVDLLIAKRIDFLLGYPEAMSKELAYFNDVARIASIEVARIPKYVVGHIECARTDAGKTFVADIDAALETLYDSPEFKQAHTRYLNESDLPVFEQYYNEVFK